LNHCRPIHMAMFCYSLLSAAVRRSQLERSRPKDNAQNAQVLNAGADMKSRQNVY
jgi:hypothetical protein